MQAQFSIFLEAEKWNITRTLRKITVYYVNTDERVEYCEICQRGRMSRVADTELILLITHLIRPPG